LNIIDIITSRRSIRKFTSEPVSEELVETILEAGRWAPSGLNNQPWRFAVIRDAGLRQAISELTHYSKIVMAAQVLITVFLDTEKSYHREKDIQAIEPVFRICCWRPTHWGLDSVAWEIIRSNEQIKAILGLARELDLIGGSCSGTS